MNNTANTPTTTKTGRVAKDRNNRGGLNGAELKRRFQALMAEHKAAAASRADLEIVKYGSKWSVDGFPQMFETRTAAQSHVDLVISVRAMRAVA
jgi:hypothetical protein